MAQQETKQDHLEAALAAAAIQDDMDALTPPGSSAQSLGNQTMHAGSSPDGYADSPDQADATAPASDQATTFLVIKDVRSISRARSLRLQPDDMIVAIDGIPFHRDIDTFLDIMFECDPENGVVLTIWRAGHLFNVIARGPLGCVIEHGKPEASDQAARDFADYKVEPKENLVIFEVLRDIFRNCIVLDTRLSPMAMIFPPLWLMQNRLWEVLIATFLIYGATLAVHWVLFIIAYIVLGLYLRKAHLILRRSFAMMRGRHIWMVVATTSELEAQRLCRRLDAKSVFVPDLVGPPVTDEPPKKRRRRRG